ncbi:MAG: DUF4347 domain-containing protein, partial [Thiogranum sp.]
MDMKAAKKISKKGQWVRKKRHALAIGICFEPLEPRLLLSGSWGAGVDAPSHDSQTSTHGGFTQETVVVSEITIGSEADTQHQNPRQTAVHVDLLAQAPVLNAVNDADSTLEASSTSNEAAPATGDTPSNSTESDSKTQPDLIAAAGNRELVFVNKNVDNYQQLIADLQGADDIRAIEVVIIDVDRDGIEQVSDILADRSDLAAVHFITHGIDGQINLGNSWLNNTTLQQNIDSISAWGNALADDGDFLFYGCNIADGRGGQLLLNEIADLTGADVAASDNPTGSARLGGDWYLEYVTGTVEASVAYSGDAPEHWAGLLGQITVTTTTDTLDGDANCNNLADLAANPGADGEISLREAIEAANNDPDADLITLNNGTYTLSGGDLVITEDLSIRGANANTTVVDGNAADRVFTIDNNSKVTLTGITIRNGNLPHNSGGVFVEFGSTLNLSDAIVRDNHSDMGGGIHVHGTANLDRVLMENNTATNQGGAIHFHDADGGSLTNVTISGNTATAEGGGLWTNSSITITNVTIADNNAVTQGGGMLVAGSTVDISNSIVADNSAGGTGNDVFGTLASSGSNLFEDFFGGLGYHGSDVSAVDPLLGLSDNGGGLWTHAPTSPLAIDGADPTLSSGIDQRGFLRDDGSPDIGAHEVGASSTPATANLWLSTEDVVVGGGQTGDDSWNPSDLIGIADPQLNLGPGTTSGTFATVFDANGFSIGWDLNAATYVKAPIQIGSSNFQLLAGDLLLSPKYNDTIFTSNNAVALDTGFQASVTANNADLVVFRPDTVGDYTQGQFGMLLEDVAGGHWLQGITLIEQNITVGGYALQAGDFLYSCSNPSISNNIWLYETGNTGFGATPDSRQVFLAGDDAGVSIWETIHGIDLLETTTEIGGQVLDAGMLLVNVDAVDTVGSNGLSVDRFDVFALKVSTSSLVGAGQATAQMLFNGSHVAFDSNEEDLDAVVMAPTSVAESPIARNDSYSTDQDTTLVISAPSGLLANDTDPNLDPISAILVTGPSNGTLTINPIGITNEFNLSNTGGTDTQPEWSPDGTKVAFVSDRSGDDEIYVVNADGSGLQQLTFNGFQDFDISWSKDGSKIAFASDRDGNMEIYTMNADGSAPNRVTFRPGSTDQRPEWSPDGTQFVFQSNRDGNWDIFTMNVDGSNPVNLTPGAGDESGPTWSPNGTKIAYRSYIGGNYDIYVMDADGGNKIRLTTHANVDNTPHWSPDGTKIVFETNRDGDYELFAIDPDGSNLTRLTDTTTRESAIVWSPDGTRFAYESDRDGNMEIYVGEIFSDGAFSYTPDAGFSGVDSFTYIASDGSNDSGVATATITVNAAPNLAPTFTSFSAPVDFTAENTEVEITFA